MSGPIHVNGALRPREGPHVSALDRGFRYGDAVFETLRVYGGTPFAWARHMDRLDASAAALAMDHGVGRSELRERVEETLAANELADAYLRISISRGVQPGTLAPREQVDPTVVIQAEPLPRGGVHGSPVWDGPADCIVAETQRVPDEAIPAHVKSHNYLNGILATIEAQEAGVDQTIMLDGEGWVTEAATANLFFVADGVLRTPTDDGLPVLPGITRETVLDLAEEAGIPTEEGRWEPSVLSTAEEVFLTNTTWEVRPVSRIGDWTYDVGPLTEELREVFAERIERECYGESGP